MPIELYFKVKDESDRQLLAEIMLDVWFLGEAEVYKTLEQNSLEMTEDYELMQSSRRKIELMDAIGEGWFDARTQKVKSCVRDMLVRELVDD